MYFTRWEILYALSAIHRTLSSLIAASCLVGKESNVTSTVVIIRIIKFSLFHSV